MRTLLERIALWFRLPGPAPVLPPVIAPARGPSRDRHLAGKARIRSRRSA